MTGPGQLILPLAYRPAQGRDDFLVSPSNALAFDAVTTGALGNRFALSGPEGSGKTHLASIWGAGTSALSLPASALVEDRMAEILDAPAIVLEDADRLGVLPPPAQTQAEALIFHLFNAAASAGKGFLITGRTPPARWSVATPDLASRLAILPHIAIDPPDDALLSSILDKLFSDRQIQAKSEVITFLLRRMERSFAAAEKIVDQLDRMALAEKRAITRPLATQLFAEHPGLEDEDI